MKKINWQYTFGEILIVIIGITIAFSLNKCSENSQEKKLRKQYLESLKRDVEIDRNNLITNLENLQNKKNQLSNSFQYFNTNSFKGDSTLITNFLRTVKIIEFSPKNSTYQTLINSGDLKIINDFSLKTAIQEHYGIYNLLDNDYERMVNISKKYIADYFIYHLDMDKLRGEKFDLSNKQLLKSIMQSMYGAVLLKITSTQNSIESCELLVEKINADLK